MARPRLLVINPNTTERVTATIRALAEEEAGGVAEVAAVTAPFGAAYIGSRAGAAIAGHAVLDAFARFADAAGPPDAVVIGCFGDPGLEALAEISGRPVVGFAEAGFRAAAALDGRFLVATNGAAWAEMLDDLLLRMRLRDRVAGIVTLDAAGPDDARAALMLGEAAASAGAARVVLGGAGLIPRMAAIVGHATVPVLDPHRAAIKDALARMRSATVPATPGGIPGGSRTPSGGASPAPVTGVSPALQAVLRNG